MGKYENIMIFEINGQTFGYPTKKIIENVTIDKTFSIPKAPYYIKGMFNLRNNPIPLINTGVLLFGSDIDSSTVIVISKENSYAGILIERLKGVINVEKEKLKNDTAIELENINSEYLDGYFEYNGDIIFLLNFDSIFVNEKVNKTKKKKELFSEKEADSSKKTMTDSEGYIIFKIDKEWFAIEVKNVNEILSYPENISPIPESPEYITGLFLMRENSVMLIDLAGFLNIYNESERERVIIVNINNHLIGLAVPFVKEIKWIEKDKILPVNNNAIGNKGIIPLDNGKRLVLIIDVENMFKNQGEYNEEHIQEEAKEGSMERLNKFLHFKIKDVNLAINIKEVQEVVEFQTINQLPKATEHIAGMINLRNRVITVISLAKLLEIEEDSNDIENKRLVVIDGAQVCFMVDKIEGILSFKEEEIQPPDTDIEIEEKFLDGIARKDEKTLVFILSIKNLLKKDEIFAN